MEGGTTKKPIILYRDGLALFKFLYGNPLFEGHQSNFPFKEWEDDDRDIRVFGGPMSRDLAWKLQVCCSLLLSNTYVSIHVNRRKSATAKH